ncbi:dynein regulatory complex protein 1 isoform X3 [Etheostoma spectabile]|uniref:dynein regulatory complex protein 1 isoform X3 n=1 Tax=Etheostoma spectabile TaxID=54343 RepID=UPI0013AF6712|nr:dynein regulatory complex protein 1 isoform X3 [Etheostoma spectabile]
MEEADDVPEEASEPSVLSENQEAKNGVSTPEVEEGPSMEVHEEFNQEPSESQPQEKLISPQRLINLQRDLSTIVTNLQTAVDAKESMRRTELEKDRRDRLQRLENDVESSQKIFEEITGGWSIAEQKVTPQELQEALNNQQQLCAALIENKKKLINDLQQELKVGDDLYVKDLRKQEEVLNLMMERMEEQMKTLINAYREELAQIGKVYHQESEVLLTRDKTEWEQHIKELWEKELERLTQRWKKVEQYEAIIHNLMLETTVKYSLLQTEQNAKFQDLDRKHQQIKVTMMITKLKQIKQKDELAISNYSLAQIKNRAISLQTEMKNLIDKNYSQKKWFTKKSQYLAVDCKRKIQQNECIKKKIKHFAVADARKFEEMWLMIEAEVKQLVEKVLVIDSLICKQYLGLAWERPHMEFMELSGPIQPQKQASQLFHTGQALQCSQRMMDLSVGSRLETDTESLNMEMYKEKTAVQSAPEMVEGKLLIETQKKVLELLCDEAGFLIKDKLLNLLAPLEKKEQTIVKLGSLLCTFGIEEEDVPNLVYFLLKYTHQQREQTEGVCDELDETSKKAEEVKTKSTIHLASDLVDPNHVVPALKSFLLQHVSSSFHGEFRDTSEDEAYWESMYIIISEDKLKFWDAVENTFKQYHSVLTDVSELIPETQSLKQQNTELRMLLQQSLNSRVSTELEMLLSKLNLESAELGQCVESSLMYFH